MFYQLLIWSRSHVQAVHLTNCTDRRRLCALMVDIFEQSKQMKTGKIIIITDLMEKIHNFKYIWLMFLGDLSNYRSAIG